MAIKIASTAFAQQSVKAFWQGVNWENRAVSSSKPHFSMALNVQDYFGMIPWSGVAIAKSVPKPLMPLDPGKSETLEDFLDDISKFF